MDIITNELKTMKVKQLRRIIRESIREILAEATVPVIIDYKNKNISDKILDIDPSDTTTLKKLKLNPAVEKITVNNKQMEEGELDEMARNPKGFRLADENLDTTPYANRSVSGASVQDILNFFRENPGADKKSLQLKFNFVRPQIANAVVNGLLDLGLLVKLGAEGEVEPTPQDKDEETSTTTPEPEDIFVGNAENPLAAYFDNIPNDDGSEDFTDSTEPEIEPPTTSPSDVSTMSDKDYEDFMKYDELSQRLATTKSNILKIKRSTRTAGDISDKPSSELQRLRDLKKSLEDRIDALVAGSDYLKNRITKTSKSDEPTETLDEWTISRMQYYAGIKK